VRDVGSKSIGCSKLREAGRECTTCSKLRLGISRMPVLFLLPALNALTLSLSCLAPRPASPPASEGCERELAVLCCRLAIRGIGGSIGGCSPMVLFPFAAAPGSSPSLVRGRETLSLLGRKESMERVLVAGGLSSKSKVICKGLTRGGGMVLVGAGMWLRVGGTVEVELVVRSCLLRTLANMVSVLASCRAGLASIWARRSSVVVPLLHSL